MNRSSAGAKSKAPPQTRQPFVLFTTVFISFTDRFTGHRISKRSAVPAGDVTAREDVLGIVKPAAATIASDAHNEGTHKGDQRLTARAAHAYVSGMTRGAIHHVTASRRD